MAKVVYPVLFSPAQEGGYCVYVPDFDVNTQGEDLAESLDMARDVIGIMGITWEDEQKQIPLPSSMENIKKEEQDILALVDIDFTEYRRKNDQRTERRNVTIPRWLNVLVKEHHINVSEVLTEALKDKLNVS